jgi:hypothetical protein
MDDDGGGDGSGGVGGGDYSLVSLGPSLKSGRSD